MIILTVVADKANPTLLPELNPNKRDAMPYIADITGTTYEYVCNTIKALAAGDYLETDVHRFFAMIPKKPSG